MSLPKRLYDVFRDISQCEIVRTKKTTAANMLEFETLLNNSNPTSETEDAQKELVRGIYYSNPIGFIRYISFPRNRVGGLILYTESKRIARFFNLQRCVHITWNTESKTYAVTKHIPRSERTEHDVPEDEAHGDQAEQAEQDIREYENDLAEHLVQMTTEDNNDEEEHLIRKTTYVRGRGRGGRGRGRGGRGRGESTRYEFGEKFQKPRVNIPKVRPDKFIKSTKTTVKKTAKPVAKFSTKKVVPDVVPEAVIGDDDHDDPEINAAPVPVQEDQEEQENREQEEQEQTAE
jgi:hypothetical protein